MALAGVSQGQCGLAMLARDAQKKSISRHPRGSAGGGWQRRNSTAPPGERPLPAGAHATSVRFGTEKQITSWGWMISPGFHRKEAHVIPLCGGSPGPGARLAQSTRRPAWEAQAAQALAKQLHQDQVTRCSPSSRVFAKHNSASEDGGLEHAAGLS